MIRKYHSLTLQTNPWHREEEPQQNTNSHKTLGRQKFKVKQPAHSWTKHRTLTVGATKNNESTTTEPPP